MTTELGDGGHRCTDLPVEAVVEAAYPGIARQRSVQCRPELPRTAAIVQSGLPDARGGCRSFS